jgi:outer membrane protein assembly factor BamB
VLPADLGKFLIHQTTSSPLVEGERLYYMTAQGQLRCLDTEGFLDGENDGPLQDEPRTAGVDADHIWELELATDLGVFPHEATNCSVVSAGSLLMVCTSNGVDEAHVNQPAPHAPSFIGVDKRTGQVAWRVVGPSPRVVHGQWSSPSLVSASNRVLACFGGGDGWLYALEASTGREVWRYDGNPPGAVWRTGGDIRGRVLRNNIIASPLVYDGTIFLAMGQDPEHGQGQGRLHAIDPSGTGDVTRNRRLWQSTEVGRTIATPIAHDGLLYVADYNGRVHCFEAKTGKRLWEHDVLAGIWGTFLLADDKLYVGDEDGRVTVLGLGREKKVLAEIDMEEPLWGAPCAVDGVLYLSTSRRVFAIAEPSLKSAASASGER